MSRPRRTGPAATRGHLAEVPAIVSLDAADGPAKPERPGAGSRTKLRYEHVMDVIERLVVERNLQPGDLLPTQAELAELAGVSLISVRRALEELERVGRVRRHQGVGTFLSGQRIVSEPGRAGGLLDTLAGEHRRPRLGSRISALERGYPSAPLAAALALRADAEVWRLVRVRLLDGRPAIVETAIIPVALAPGLDELSEGLSGSLYEALAERYGLRDDHEEQYLEVSAASADERRLLALASGAQVVRLRGLSITAQGLPFDCFEQVYPATEFAFYISGGTEKRLLSSLGDWEMNVNPRGHE
ncbi:MAG TPA: GntR family transcriptional regulator [Solirubrobacteraceae bacterium]|nr:GntR family transcriptional regulator [Solirubrobacteraceae bacterium]